MAAPPRQGVISLAVKDKAMLDAVKAGDRIRFKAINDAGKYTVTDIERAD